MKSSTRFSCRLRNRPVPPARRPSAWLFVLGALASLTLGALLANAF